jgi:hypothetical protein
MAFTDYMPVFAKIIPYIILVDLMLSGFYLYTRNSEDIEVEEVKELEELEELDDVDDVDEDYLEDDVIDEQFDEEQILEQEHERIVAKIQELEPEQDHERIIPKIQEPAPKIQELEPEQVVSEDAPKRNEIPIKSKRGRKPKAKVVDVMDVIPEVETFEIQDKVTE